MFVRNKQLFHPGLLLVLGLLNLNNSVADTSPEDPCRAMFMHWLAWDKDPAVNGPQQPSLRADLAYLYQSVAGRNLWSVAGVATPQGKVLTQRLSQAGRKGLSVEAYDAVSWSKRLHYPNADPGPMPQCREQALDLALSAAAMSYVSHLRLGKVNPRELDVGLDVEPKRFDLAEFLLKLATAADPGKLLDGLEPPFQSYQALVKALQHYQALAADPQMQKPLNFSNGKELKTLAYRLEKWGDLPAGRAATFKGITYDKDLTQAIKSFQRRHGLTQDGVIRGETITELNVPMSERVRQIQLSLERWRWMPDDLGHRPLFVNVPEYKLYGFEKETSGEYRLALEMSVIVGESYPEHRTPLFHSSMRYVVFAPYWNVPNTILRRELYPKIRSDPSYLSRHRYEIVRNSGSGENGLPATANTLGGLWQGNLRLRQRPGAHNALGEVKFMFPNKYSVYLHGTPRKGLFARQKRDLSHGCVRLSDAPRLAAHILSQEAGWDQARVDALIASGKNRQVNLTTPVDVYILYGTAVADPNGVVRFFHDVYSYDERLSQALARLSQEGPAI